MSGGLRKAVEHLDTRAFTHRERASAAFHRFGNLPPGEAFELVDHRELDSLSAQFQEELPGVFTWESLGGGPGMRRARIGRV